MSQAQAIHLVAINVAGYGPSDGKCLPCSGVSGIAVSVSPYSTRNDYKPLSKPKVSLVKCASKGKLFVCKASPSGHRRNPDFSRHNDHGFSRSKNRQNEEKVGSQNFEKSDLFSSKNGPLLPFLGTPKFQATASPGPREKEIVELFRKVQAQLRERSAIREEKKTEDLQGKDKENETVESLLKLLRRHSGEQGKRSRDFSLDQPEQKSPFDEEKSTSFINSNKDRESPSFTRPISNFQRRSPVPHVKFESIYSNENTFNSFSDANLGVKREYIRAEPRVELEPEAESTFSDGDVFDGISEVGISDTDEGYSEVDAAEQEHNIKEDLSAMKVSELRELAKSRGIKGFSKLKKRELVELLSGGSF